MRTILLVAQKEIILSFRDARLMGLGCIVLTLMLVAAFTGYKAYLIQKQDRESAQHANRVEWENQGPKHPHIAAHFGTFIFKPKSFLSFLDFGIDNYTGTFVYLEAHKQNNFVFKPSQEYEAVVRFGELTGAAVMQLFIPLMILFLCFGSIASEKEQGRLKLLFIQGVSIREIIWGKIVGAFGIILAILIAGLILASLPPFLFTQSLSIAELLYGGILLMILYALYFLIAITFSVMVSAFASSSKNALLILLTIWICLAIVFPKAIANIGDELYPLPTEVTFKSKISYDVEKGLDGHNSSDKRAKELGRAYLKKYGVDSVHKLPVNFDGILLVESEEYTSKVFDKHFTELQKLYSAQNEIGSITSLANPYLAMRNLSMGISQTDFYTHLSFQRQAEQYRRRFVQELNRDMAFNSKMNEFETYKGNEELWKSVPPFRYSPLSLTEILLNYKKELISLIVWIFLLGAGIFYTSSKIRIL